MNRLTKITLLASGLVLLAGLPGVVPGFRPSDFNAMAQAAPPDVLSFDVAIDCRTIVNGPNRGDLYINNGKLFPAGALPSGAASFDPTQPVNGVAPIGDWIIRGQHNFPFPPAIASSYSSSPFDFATGYFILDDGRTALILEAYNFVPSGKSFASVTGGIGRFSGAAGDLEGEPPIGTNATGCWNLRVRFNLKKDAPNYPGWPQ